MQKRGKKEQEEGRKKDVAYTTNYCTFLPTKILITCNDHI
jgi:hypothetical protein